MIFGQYYHHQLTKDFINICVNIRKEVKKMTDIQDKKVEIKKEPVKTAEEIKKVEVVAKEATEEKAT